MLNVIAFLRVSTEEQAGENRAGLLRQRQDIRDACNRYGLAIIETIELTDVSGASTMEASEYRAMLRQLENPEIQGVVVSSVDRLVRPEKLGDLAVFDPFTRFRKRIWTPSQIIDLAEDSGFMVTAIQSVMAGVERKQILRRIQTAKEEQRKRGRLANAKITLPKGVDFDFKTGIWSWVEPWAARIQAALELLVAGHSVKSIAREVGGYSDRGLANALRNPIWIGIRRYDQKRGDKYPTRNGRQPDRRKIRRSDPLEVQIGIQPLVSRAVWDHAQQVLSATKESWNAKRSATSRFLVGGIAYCRCGERMYTRGDKRKGKHDIYYCKSRHPRGQGCGAKVLHRETVDLNVANLLAVRLADPNFLVGVMKEALQAEWSRRAAPGNPGEFIAQIENLRKQRARVIGMATRGQITDGELDAELTRIAQDTRVWELKLASTGTFIAPDAVPELAVHILTTLAEFSSLPGPDARTILQSLVAGLVITEAGIEKLTIKLPEVVASPRTHAGEKLLGNVSF